MASVLELNQNNALMPYIRFERRPVEDKAESAQKGHYVAKDVDFALVTPSFSKDVMIHKVSTWLEQIKVDVANQRIPQEWAELWKKSYDAWVNGQELPIDGTPIKGWGVISPAQQETLIRLHILTVEKLAAINAEGISRLGMGGTDLKNKAQAWLKQLSNAGSATMEISELKKENENLRANIDALSKTLNKLMMAIEGEKVEPIKADDIM